MAPASSRKAMRTERREQMDLLLEERHRIQDVPPSMFYIPDFISKDEEAHILQSIPSKKWINLTHRRLQSLPARLTATNTLLTSQTLPTWLTDPVVPHLDNLGFFEGSPHGGVNHCLINEYLPGQGIMPHEDGGAYHPVVATVSLGGSVVLDVTEKRRPGLPTGQDEAQQPTNGNDDDDEADAEKPAVKHWRILQEPRSLLVTTGSAYTDTLHGIAEITVDTNLNEQTVANWSLLGDRDTVVANGGRNERTTRISLTYRDVRKVSTIGSKLFGKAKG